MATAAGDASAAAAGEQQDPQLYLEELALQDCSCSAPTLLPSWRKWPQKSHAGKRKLQPTPRGGHASVWVPFGSSGTATAAGSLVVFGGSNRQAATFADVWRFDLTSNEWTSVSVSGASPSLRSGHSAVYHAASQRIIIFGGQQLTVTLSGEMDAKFHRDVFALDCKSWAWSKLPDSGDAPQRNGHSAIVLTGASSDRMVVFGGSDKDGPSATVWSYDLSSNSWAPVSTTGHSPEARELHAACLVETPDLQRWMVISSGRGMNGLLNTCHALRLPSAAGNATSSAAAQPWEWLLVGQSPARCAHSMLPLHAACATDPVLPILIVSPPAAATESAAAASSAAATASSSSSSLASSSIPLLLFGGTDGQMFYNDVLSFSFSPEALSSSAAPPSPCAECQGPKGWTTLQRPENKPDQPQGQEQEDTEVAAAASSLAGASLDGTASASAAAKKKKKKRKSMVDVQPPTCFAHTLTSTPCPSLAFASPSSAAAAVSAAASATSASSSQPLVPSTFVLFGGMNDEADLDETHLLSFVPFG